MSKKSKEAEKEVDDSTSVEEEPTYGQMKAALVEQLIETARAKVVVRRPNVFADVTFFHEDEVIAGYGFAKVCRPDKWDKKDGIEMAVRKAANYTAKLLLLPEEKLKQLPPTEVIEI